MNDERHPAAAMAECLDVEHHVEVAETDAEGFAEAKAWNDRIAALVGAAVENDDGEVLFVDHGGYDGWVTPGGEAELGEDLRAAAAREVLEETGVKASIGDPLIVMEFTNKHEGRATTGYLVLFEGEALDPETADDPGLPGEDIREARWLDRIPDGTPDDPTTERTMALVEERFDLG